jgi:hypothetical protein
LRDPTAVSFLRRWGPAISMLLVSVISYIDRQTLALLSPTILRETHLSGEQYGFIISGFSVAYMISNPVWGRVLDRIGLRSGMTLSVAWWTLASAAHSLASGFAGFAAARIALGWGEGDTFPGGLRTVTQTPPALAEGTRRGRGVLGRITGSDHHAHCGDADRATVGLARCVFVHRHDRGSVARRVADSLAEFQSRGQSAASRHATAAV